MAGRTKHNPKIESPTGRAKLKPQREPYWESLTESAALGYRRSKGEGIGRWLLRQRKPGTRLYNRKTLGLADDGKMVADGRAVLSFLDAKAEGLKRLGAIKSPSRFLVRHACAHYIDYRIAQGKQVNEIERTIVCHILPKLGHIPVAELTTVALRSWHGALAAGPAMARTKTGAERNFKRADAADPQVARRRRSTANRLLATLRAILNRAFKDELVADPTAWGKRLEAFPGVDRVRLQYLTVAEGERLVNASDDDFKPLLIAALECGARYSELCRLVCEDYHPDNKTIFVAESKSGKPRYITLSDSGARFFSSVVAGRPAKQLMFRKKSGDGWRDSDQGRRMKDSCARARIVPPVPFHALRHSYASALIAGGTSLLVVSRNLGHSSTSMTEKTYAHLASSYVREEVNKGAPTYRFNIAALKVRAIR